MAKFLEAMYENKLEFPGGTGGGGGAKQKKNIHGGSMDIFWNCTLSQTSKGDENWLETS